MRKNIPATYDEVCYPAWKAIPVEIQSNDYITAYTKENKNIVVGWEQAEKIIVIGNGVDKNGYPLIEQFAKQINAEIAGTRRAVENGLLPVERMIGISGKSISPKLCIVIGASGLAAFVKGIEKSECIVSINSDKDALIFKYADYGIIGHYQEGSNSNIVIFSTIPRCYCKDYIMHCMMCIFSILYTFRKQIANNLN